MDKKELTVYNVNAETFEWVLTEYKSLIKVKEDLSDYVGGYQNRRIIYYNGWNKLIIQEILLNLGKDSPRWKQCILYRRDDQKEAYKKSISGGMAYRVMKSKLLKYYTEEEFDKAMKRFQANYDSEKAQLHYSYVEPDNKIHKYKNCVKYDINGAYAKALIEIFPKAKDLILDLYNNRKTKPINKDYINYFVGCFCIYGYRRTYNYIVQKIRAQIDSTIKKCRGILLYANTDGFAVSCPKNKPERIGKELGQFKIEYEGDIYTFTGKNYWIMQCGDETKGSCLWYARKSVDLRVGKVVEYDTYKDDYVRRPINIKILEKYINEETY